MARLRDSARLLEIIAFQSEIAASPLAPEEVMRRVTERAEQLTHADAAVVERADGDEMVYEVATGTAAEHIGLRLARATSLSGACVARAEVLACEDTEDDPRVDREACRRVGVRSMVCVPLIHQDEAIGVLKVMAARPCAFGADDVETLRVLSGLIAAHLSHASQFAAAERDSRRDPLTGLGNRRAFDERLGSEVARARRHAHPLSLIVVDLDGFKELNDGRGHPAGDSALREVGAVLGALRREDEGFRIGGDEFAVVLPDTEAVGAYVVGRRIVEEIAARTPVGASAGIAQLGRPATADALLAEADAALYEDKRGRRGAVG